MGDDPLNDTDILKITAVILVMVVISSMAQTDGNNPMAEIGIPFDADSFNIYALGQQAPSLPLAQVPDFGGTDEEKYCWIEWFCPDLPTDEVAQAIHRGVTVFYNFIVQILNSVLWGGTVILLFLYNFMVIFNFASWGAFQGSTFLLLFGVLLTALLGGSVLLWLFQKITGSIPFVGG